MIMVRGDLIRVYAGTPRTRADGSGGWTPGVVKVFDGENVANIEYPSLAAAEAAVGDAVRGDLVEVPVRLRAYKDRVYFSGLRDAAGEAVA